MVMGSVFVISFIFLIIRDKVLVVIVILLILLRRWGVYVSFSRRNNVAVRAMIGCQSIFVGQDFCCGCREPAAVNAAVSPVNLGLINKINTPTIKV
jgi:hypothetical protein